LVRNFNILFPKEIPFLIQFQYFLPKLMLSGPEALAFPDMSYSIWLHD